MMGPVALVRYVDTKVQKRFDGAVHALMRKMGWSKRFIRRNLWGFAVAMLIGQDTLSPAPLRWYHVCIWLAYAGIMYMDDALDAKAERTHEVASAADSWRSARFWKLLGTMQVGFGVSWAVRLGLRPGDVCNMLFWAACVCHGYLIRTSPQAPKKSPKRSADQAPAFARAAHE